MSVARTPVVLVALLQFVPTSSTGTPTDRLNEEEKAWFMDGMCQCVGTRQTWAVTEL